MYASILCRVKTPDQCEEAALAVGSFFIYLHFELQINFSQFLGF